VTFRGRLTVFLSALVLAPLAAGGVAAHVLAARQAVRDADARLQSVELRVEQAEQQAVDTVRFEVTPALARAAFASSRSEVDGIRRSAHLDFLVVLRSGHVRAAAMGSPRFDPAFAVSARRIALSPTGPYELRRIHLAGAAQGLVVGGVYLDRTFLQSLPAPAMTVSGGRVVASVLSDGPARIPAGNSPFDLRDRLRGLCVCSSVDPSGIVVTTGVDHVGLMPGRSGWVLALIAIGIVLGTGLAFELARVLSRPHDRALGRLAESERLSLTDALTGVPNRRHLEAVLADEARRAARYRRAFSVLMVDVDHFKRINDSHGHETGDRVLIEVAARIRGAVRADLDTVARYGGEEFTVVLPETALEGALVVAEKIRVAVANTAIERLAVTISVGVASCPDDGADPPGLLHAADRALYEAKRAGRDRVMAGR
jgi:diguanylate cyclase (GGDEF)-like protein